MNGQRAKRLRARAQAESIGLPERRYTGGNRAGDRTIRLVPGCTRRIYQRLKRTRKEV